MPRANYYYHCNNKVNSYHVANENLDKHILKIYKDSKFRYGSPKIQKMLEKQGVKASQKRVARRMNILGIKSIVVKKYRHQTSSKKVDDKARPNLLEQQFKADKPNEKWVGDITYIYTKENGWTYLAIVMDLFSLKIIGYSYGTNMTDKLVIEAFKKALNNSGYNKSMIFHSDLGSQYTSNDFERLLESLKIKHSYSKKGYPYDNASMESFNSILKKEEVNTKVYNTLNQARLAIFEFIESWYNRSRIHSSLGYMTPYEKEMSYIGQN